MIENPIDWILSKNLEILQSNTYKWFKCMLRIPAADVIIKFQKILWCDSDELHEWKSSDCTEYTKSFEKDFELLIMFSLKKKKPLYSYIIKWFPTKIFIHKEEIIFKSGVAQLGHSICNFWESFFTYHWCFNDGFKIFLH